MTEYLETKYASKVKIVQLRKPQREWYKVHIICEFDDESEMHDTIELDGMRLSLFWRLEPVCKTGLASLLHHTLSRASRSQGRITK